MTLFDKEITSPDNAVFRALRECAQSKGIRKHGLFLLHGRRAVREMLERYPERVRDVIFADEAEFQADGDFRTLITKARAKGSVSVLRLSPALFRELDVFAMKEPMLAVAAPDLPVADLSQAPKGLEILCALGDPANVGALLRSAAAFGVSRVVLLRESASPFHPKAVRAATATTLITPLARGPSIAELTGPLIALDMEGTPLPEFRWPKNARLLLGEEGQGLPAHETFQRVAIPIEARVESLNAPIALSIALYAYRSQLNQNV